jgi:hypothetical protein
LPQELGVFEQFDLALDQQVLQVGKDLRSCLRPESTNLVRYSELKQVLADDVAAELVTDCGIYAVVIEDRLPLIILTGLAMSPAITSVFPVLVNVFGGQQSARTIHFFVASFLVLFLLVHIAMVCLAGFKNRIRAMITGRTAARKEPS